MVLGVSYCLGSGLSFTNALVVTIEIYCYDQCIREELSTAKNHSPMTVSVKGSFNGKITNLKGLKVLKHTLENLEMIQNNGYNLQEK